MLLISRLLTGYVNFDFILKQREMSLLCFEVSHIVGQTLMLTILKYKTIFIISKHYNSNFITYNMHISSAIYMTSLWPNLDHLLWTCVTHHCILKKNIFSMMYHNGKLTCIDMPWPLRCDLFSDEYCFQLPSHLNSRGISVYFKIMRG